MGGAAAAGALESVAALSSSTMLIGTVGAMRVGTAAEGGGEGVPTDWRRRNTISSVEPTALDASAMTALWP